MLRYELIKLFVKRYTIPFAIIVIIIETIFFSAVYREKEFPNETDKNNYYSIMSVVEGKLDNAKKQYILSERAEVRSAQSELEKLQNNLMSGMYSDRSEYVKACSELQAILKKEYAVNLVYEQYKYCAADTENRYMISYGYEGMCRDYPDVPMLIFIITVTAIYFLDEETSMMIMLIKSCRNRSNNTFIAKFSAVVIMIISLQIIISLIEYIFINLGIHNYLGFPIQSIQYFGGCKFKLTIFGTFAAIQAVKALGYIFISMLTALICMTVRKPIPSVGIPSAVCLIQQFIFKSADDAYYLPSGLLRATGYFRGDSIETVTLYGYTMQTKSFSEVPAYVFYGNIIAAALFAVVVFFVGQWHYKCLHYQCLHYKNLRITKKMMCLALAVLFFNGCSQETESKDIYFNLSLSSAFAQNDDYYFTNETEITDSGEILTELTTNVKSTNEKFNSIHDIFDDNITANNFCVVGNKLYLMTFLNARGFALYEISTDDYSIKYVSGQTMESDYSFLGLMLSGNVKLDKTVLNFFTDGTTLYLITSDSEIYKTDFNLTSPECIISDGIYNFNLVYDGRMIYYINNELELKAYDTANNTEALISDEFVMAFDLDGSDLIYSNDNGIFRHSLSNNSETCLTSETADKISVKQGTIVFLKNDTLYHLENNSVSEIYSGRIMNFSVMSDGRSVFYRTGEKNGLVNNTVAIE